MKPVNLLVILLAATVASLAHATTYDEALNGDLFWSSDTDIAFAGGSIAVFDLDVGVNTISGTTSLVGCQIPCDSTDNDSFAVRVGPDQYIVSAIVTYARRESPIDAIWVYGESTEPDWSTGCSNECAGFRMSDGSQIELSDISNPGPGTTIFSLNGHGGNPFLAGYIDYTFSFVVTTVQQLVEIDVKPDSEPNAIRVESNQQIAVAILGGESFDSTQVDPLTVTFGPGSVHGQHKQPHVGDVNADGFVDLLFHFQADETDLHCGDSTAELRGRLYDGSQFVGVDSIKVVPCQ